MYIEFLKKTHTHEVYRGQKEAKDKLPTFKGPEPKRQVINTGEVKKKKNL